MSKILVTGGAGFIGSQIGYHLYNLGHEIILLDNMSYGHEDNLIINGKRFGTFIKEDVRSPAIYDIMHGVDYVFHFAGIAPLPVNQENPYEAISVNVAGTANVLDAARKIGVKRFIFASTSAIYENNTVFPSKEDERVAPNLVYATSKLQCELLCKSFYEVYGLPTVMLRFFNVYGPHQDFRRLSPPLTGYIIRELLQNRVPTLHSNGNQSRDYVYIDDLIEMAMICMGHPEAPGEIFNVASGLPHSVNYIYQELSEALGKSHIKPVFREAKLLWEKYPALFTGAMTLDEHRLEKEVNKYALGSTKKSENILGWKAKTSLRKGMTKTAEYALTLGLDKYWISK